MRFPDGTTKGKSEGHIFQWNKQKCIVVANCALRFNAMAIAEFENAIAVAYWYGKYKRGWLVIKEVGSENVRS